MTNTANTVRPDLGAQEGGHDSTAGSAVAALIRDVINTTSLTDPRAIAEQVATSTPEQHLRAAFESLLVEHVRSILGQQRNKALSAATRQGASAKLRGRRDWWASVLESRLYVGAGNWRMLGDCTATDLQFAAKQRREDAEREMGRARTYDTLRSALRVHRVATVAELPPDVLTPAVLRDVA